MINGWVLVHRKIKDKGWYLNSKYVHLWVHILIKANHEEKEFMFNGEIHKTKRGEFITGRKALSKETGIAGSTIERILEVFEKDGQIGQQTNNKFRLISVINYDKYQCNESFMDNKRTTNGQQTDTNKEVKELKEYTIATKVAEEIPFNGKEFIEKCCADKQDHIRLIGNYMKIKKMDFPTKKTAVAELRRNMKVATILKDYPPERRKKALVEANKMTKQWTLETILKYLNK